MILIVVATVDGFWALVIAMVNLSLPIQDWSISAYIFASTFIGLLIATFVI